MGYFICFMLGSIFGIATMCLFQVNKINEYEKETKNGIKEGN